MSKRRQQKLVLRDEEIERIKGIHKHTNLNDQMICSIFSHVSRTINHREISYFRDQFNPKYKNYQTASKDKVSSFLSHYDRFEKLTKLHGLQPKEDYFDLIQKASEAMKNAVAIHNNPNIKWKTETFIVNAIIAWTYLFHAYYMMHDIDFVSRYTDGKPKLSSEGRPLLWGLSKCIKDENACPLPKAVIANLSYLIAIRDEIVHSMCKYLDKYIGGKLQACALNFNRYLCEWFGNKHSLSEELAFSIQFCALSLQSHPEIVGDSTLPTIIKTVNRIIEKDLSSDEYNDPQYSYRLFVVPRTTNNRNKADQAVKYAPLGSEVEMAVREVERPKYTAGAIVDMMKEEGYEGFSTHGKNGFVAFWKSINGKNPSKGLGVEVIGQWVWYEGMVDAVRAELIKRQSSQVS